MELHRVGEQGKRGKDGERGPRSQEKEEVVSEGWYWVQPDSHPSFATSTLLGESFPLSGPQFTHLQRVQFVLWISSPQLGSFVSPFTSLTASENHLHCYPLILGFVGSIFIRLHFF